MPKGSSDHNGAGLSGADLRESAPQEGGLVSAGPGGTLDAAFLILGVKAGLRASDLLGLTMGRAQGDNRRIRQAVELAGRKTGKAKAFPVSDAAREALLPLLAALAAKGAAGPRGLGRHRRASA